MMRRLLPFLAGLCLSLGAAAQTPPSSLPTLEAVRIRGEVVCGTHPNLAGFAQPGADRRMVGFDADICRAVAAAVLGDAEKVRFERVTLADGLVAVQDRRVDLLSRNVTQTMLRDTAYGLAAAGVAFYDGQGFLLRRALGARGVADLGGRTVCVNRESTHELNLADVARRAGITLTPLVLPSLEHVIGAYIAGQCDVATSDASILASFLATRIEDRAAHELLPDRTSREPLGPFVRDGDRPWEMVVTWTLNLLLEAEFLGITAANAEALRAGPSPQIRRLLGAEPGIGAPLGLDDGWAFRVIAQLGNYAEIYARHLGPGTPLDLPRGLNELFTRGGLHYPIPMR